MPVRHAPRVTKMPDTGILITWDHRGFVEEPELPAVLQLLVYPEKQCYELVVIAGGEGQRVRLEVMLDEYRLIWVCSLALREAVRLTDDTCQVNGLTLDELQVLSAELHVRRSMILRTLYRALGLYESLQGSVQLLNGRETAVIDERLLLSLVLSPLPEPFDLVRMPRES